MDNSQMRIIAILASVILLFLGGLVGRQTVYSQVQDNKTNIAVIQAELKSINQGISDIKEMVRK